MSNLTIDEETAGNNGDGVERPGGTAAAAPAPVAAPAREPSTVIDTSKMSKGERDPLELTEAARDTGDGYTSFAGGIFMGRPRPGAIFPYPGQPAEDRAAGAPFLRELEGILSDETDPDAIDAEGEVPDAVIARLAEAGAFAIKVPAEYGGLGLSQTNYCRAAVQLGSHCGNLTALLSAHQSIGVPQPLLLFGSEEQKRRFLPRFREGQISAFALTEVGVGSDPSKMTTEAVPVDGGRYWEISGEKLWCTNGTKASVIIVMARTPDREVNGRKKRQITAFIVEMDTPGVEVSHRCHFMGLRALYNGVIRFDKVRVPAENIVGGEGKGLKVALTTLNTGRLTLPAACLGLAKRCLGISRKWAAEREQWGAPIGHHQAVGDKVARMAADVFALESAVFLTAALVDREHADIRLEAAMCKMWGSEVAWRIVDDTLQLRGGRGYETAASLAARGEEPVAVERFMRDCRINLIFEGSSEIMRLFLAREALDPHLTVAGGALDSRLPASQRLASAARAGLFYAGWYPRLWLPFNGAAVPRGMHPAPAAAMRTVAAGSRRLARSLFHAMARHGPKLDKQQLLLGRLVDIGTELFVLAAAALRADAIIKAADGAGERAGPAENTARLLAFCHRKAQLALRRSFDGVRHNNDRAVAPLVREVLGGGYAGLEDGVVEGNDGPHSMRA